MFWYKLSEEEKKKTCDTHEIVMWNFPLTDCLSKAFDKCSIWSEHVCEAVQRTVLPDDTCAFLISIFVCDTGTVSVYQFRAKQEIRIYWLFSRFVGWFMQFNWFLFLCDKALKQFYRYLAQCAQSLAFALSRFFPLVRTSCIYRNATMLLFHFICVVCAFVCLSVCVFVHCVYFQFYGRIDEKFTHFSISVAMTATKRRNERCYISRIEVVSNTPASCSSWIHHTNARTHIFCVTDTNLYNSNPLSCT